MRLRPPRPTPVAAALAPAVAAALAVAAVVGAPPGARARVEAAFAYPYAKVWSTAVRLLRVDLGYTITDRDEANGYVLFEYDDGGRTHAGTVELIGGRAPEDAEVRVVVRVPSMPSWVERVLLDRLARKLREDYGDPVARPRPAPDPPAPGPAPDAPSAGEPTPRRAEEPAWATRHAG